MAETPSLPPSLPSGVRAADAARGPASAPRPGASAPAFEALLERLTARAAELEAQSHTLTDPAELPQALDTARASLEEALALGEGLLEAFRAAEIARGEQE
ncbi:MAG TPA: hypothetical protein VF530_19240 [Planctomycetota bacterium]